MTETCPECGEPAEDVEDWGGGKRRFIHEKDDESAFRITDWCLVTGENQ